MGTLLGIHPIVPWVMHWKKISTNFSLTSHWRSISSPFEKVSSIPKTYSSDRLPTIIIQHVSMFQGVVSYAKKCKRLSKKTHFFLKLTTLLGSKLDIQPPTIHLQPTNPPSDTRSSGPICGFPNIRGQGHIDHQCSSDWWWCKPKKNHPTLRFAVNRPGKNTPNIRLMVQKSGKLTSWYGR